VSISVYGTKLFTLKIQPLPPQQYRFFFFILCTSFKHR